MNREKRSVLRKLGQGERQRIFDLIELSKPQSNVKSVWGWCAIEGDDRNSPQCDPSEDYGWILHGLWPQFETGWPSYCNTSARNPSRSDTGAMADIMGTSGLAWHQWKKHGRCSGLSSEDYFALSRDAYGTITRPEILRKLTDPIKLPAKVIEDAFLEANPNLNASGITITCKKQYIQEARICFTKGLELRQCGEDTRRDCDINSALFEPIR